MRKYIIQYGAALILAISLAGHVSEIFDHWDNTVQTGGDVDYGAVMVAVLAGAVLTLPHVVRLIVCALSVKTHLSFSPADAIRRAPILIFAVDQSPPPILRI